MAVSAHRVLAVALGALAALFAKSLCVSAGDVFGALAIPLHRSSIPLERVFGPVCELQYAPGAVVAVPDVACDVC